MGGERRLAPSSARDRGCGAARARRARVRLHEQIGRRLSHSSPTSLNIRIALRSLDEPEAMDGVDLRQHGYLFLLDNDADVEPIPGGLALQHALGLPSREPLRRRGAGDRSAGRPRGPARGDLLRSLDGYLSPEDVVQWYARGADVRQSLRGHGHRHPTRPHPRCGDDPGPDRDGDRGLLRRSLVAGDRGDGGRRHPGARRATVDALHAIGRRPAGTSAPLPSISRRASTSTARGRGSPSAAASRRWKGGGAGLMKPSTSSRPVAATSSPPTRRGGFVRRSPAPSPTRPDDSCPGALIETINKLIRTSRALVQELGRDRPRRDRQAHGHPGLEGALSAEDRAGTISLETPIEEEDARLPTYRGSPGRVADQAR